MKIQLTMPWGEALRVTVARSGGLTPAVHRIRDRAMGCMCPTPNTFATLFDVADPALMLPNRKMRAWMLLLAIGEEPEAWGIDLSWWRKVMGQQDPAFFRSLLTEAAAT